MIPRINSGCFTWQLWRGGCLIDLGVQVNKKEWIVENRTLLQRYAIGYCPAELTPCRPRINYIAVMFQKDDLEFWTHLTREEFEIVFMRGEKE